MKRFLCWLKYGHIWKMVGGFDNKTTMYQCQHCFLVEVFDDVNGDRR